MSEGFVRKITYFLNKTLSALIVKRACFLLAQITKNNMTDLCT